MASTLSNPTGHYGENWAMCQAAQKGTPSLHCRLDDREASLVSWVFEFRNRPGENTIGTQAMKSAALHKLFNLISRRLKSLLTTAW